MKNLKSLRTPFFAAIAMMMTAGLFSCKSKEAESNEVDVDTVTTTNVQEVETISTDTTSMTNDTLTPTP